MSKSASPPDFLSAADRYHRRFKGFIQRRMPLGCHFRFCRSQIVESCKDLFIGAIGTAGLGEGSGGNSSFPHMSQLTLPPNVRIAVRRNLLRRKCAVLFSAPLGRDFGIKCFQIIDSGNNDLSAANRAITALRPRIYCSLPFMAPLTAPPDPSGGFCDQLCRFQFPVLIGVPLGSQAGITGSQIIFPNQNRPVGTDRTTAALNSGLDGCTPFMTFLTDPPYGNMTLGQILFRSVIRILPRMPLGSNLRVKSLQVRTGSHRFSGTVRAAPLLSCAGIDPALPFMSMSALPPYLCMASIGQLLRIILRIFGRMPFIDQVFPAVLTAVFYE